MSQGQPCALKGQKKHYFTPTFYFPPLYEEEDPLVSRQRIKVGRAFASKTGKSRDPKQSFREIIIPVADVIISINMAYLLHTIVYCFSGYCICCMLLHINECLLTLHACHGLSRIVSLILTPGLHATAY